MYNRYWVLQWVRRENLCERDTATPRWPVRGRERERQADIYGRGAREALRLRLLATALAVFTMMCSHTRSSPSIWEFLPFSPHVAPSHVVSLVPGTKNIYRRLFRGWERRGGTRGWEQERSVISRYRGLPAFWNRADRLHSRYRTCLQFHEPSRHDFYDFRISVAYLRRVSLVKSQKLIRELSKKLTFIYFF